jgi:hypothetical protein
MCQHRRSCLPCRGQAATLAQGEARRARRAGQGGRGGRGAAPRKRATSLEPSRVRYILPQHRQFAAARSGSGGPAGAAAAPFLALCVTVRLPAWRCPCRIGHSSAQHFSHCRASKHCSVLHSARAGCSPDGQVRSEWAATPRRPAHQTSAPLSSSTGMLGHRAAKAHTLGEHGKSAAQACVRALWQSVVLKLPLRLALPRETAPPGAWCRRRPPGSPALFHQPLPGRGRLGLPPRYPPACTHPSRAPSPAPF